MERNDRLSGMPHAERRIFLIGMLDISSMTPVNRSMSNISSFANDDVIWTGSTF